MSLDGSYLDRDGLKRTIGAVSGVRLQLVDGSFIPSTNATAIASWRSFVESRLRVRTSEIDARLRKRYAAPFVAPVPPIVEGWLAALVLPDLYDARGWDPTDEQAKSILDRASNADTQIQQAADAVDGLFDLPLRTDTTETGIVKGTPLAYSEASPWDWIDVQRRRVRTGSGR